MSPQSRALLGQTQAIQLLELMVAIGVGYALYTVYLHVIVDKGRSKPKPPAITDTTVEPVVTAMPMATVAPTAAPVTTVMPISTAVPKAEEEDDPCMPLLYECLENPKQPKWNVKDYGKDKKCGDCYRECHTHSKGTHAWPDYKCPRPGQQAPTTKK